MATRGKIQYDVTANTARFTSQMQKVDGRLKGFGKNMKNLAALAAGTFAVGRIASFANELEELQDKVTSVSLAFQALNRPGLLSELQAATGGAVDNLTLMQKAVEAKNLGIPIEKLATLFEFASIRAAETGKSVDSLVDSIVTGIGRKSALVLDNLGIIMSTAGKTTGEVTDAVERLAKESIATSAVSIEDAATSTDKLAAAWTNLKIAASEGAGPIGAIKDFFADLLVSITPLARSIDSQGARINAQIISLGKELEKLQNLPRGSNAFTDFLLNPLRDIDAEISSVTLKIEKLKKQLALLHAPPPPPGGGGGVITDVFSGPAFSRSKLAQDLSSIGLVSPKAGLTGAKGGGIGGLLDAENMREVTDISFDLREAMREIRLEIQPIPEFAEDWEGAMHRIEGVAGSIVDILSRAGVKLQGIIKGLQIIRSGFNLFRLLTGVGPGGGAPQGPNITLTAKGADLHGVVKSRDLIAAGLGAG